MKDWEVRAILDGSKMQARRPVKTTASGRVKLPGHPNNWHLDDLDCVKACPYGKAGDRLWVRETWSSDFAKNYPHDRIWYAADDDRKNDIEVRNGVRGIFSPESQEYVPFRWHPSIHMFRWASRITLEIVSVRVERLRDISEADALAEGVSRLPDPPSGQWSGQNRFTLRVDDVSFNAPTAKEVYAKLCKFNSPTHSWGENPWVWVTEFKLI